MVNYNNGKIYKIEPICEHEEGEIYIGSTTKELLCQRMTAHRKDYNRWKNGKRCLTTSFNLFEKYGIENCKILLLEEVNVNSNDELKAREAYYIKILSCVNKYMPLRTKKEWENDNKELISQKKKIYREINRDIILGKQKFIRESNKQKIREKAKEIISCECGSCVRKDFKSKHMKTTKHIQYIESLTN